MGRLPRHSSNFGGHSIDDFEKSTYTFLLDNSIFALCISKNAHVQYRGAPGTGSIALNRFLVIQQKQLFSLMSLETNSVGDSRPAIGKPLVVFLYVLMNL